MPRVVLAAGKRPILEIGDAVRNSLNLSVLRIDWSASRLGNYARAISVHSVLA